MQRLKTRRVFSLFSISVFCLYSSNAVAQVLTEQDILARIKQHNPLLQSLSEEREAKERLVEQADLPPNPELSVTAEQFGEAIQGSSPSQAEMRIDQLIERGGKRQARVAVAEAEKEFTELKSAIESQDILLQGKRLWSELIYLKGQTRLRQEELKLNKEIVETVKRRVDAGATLPAELTKAETQGRLLGIERRNFEDLLQQSKFSLSSLWGGQPSDLNSFEEHSEEREPFQLLTADPKQTLRYRLAESLCHREDQIVRQEQAKATQDVTLGAGYQRLQGVKYNALLVSVSVPLPFSNRNEAGILSAERMASSCRMKLSHEELQIKTLLNNLGARRRTLENERQELDRSLLPGARKSLEQTRSAFVLGKASFLEIADAQKSMIALKVRSLEIQKELSDTLFEAESLFGKH